MLALYVKRLGDAKDTKLDSSSAYDTVVFLESFFLSMINVRNECRSRETTQCHLSTLRIMNWSSHGNCRQCRAQLPGSPGENSPFRFSFDDASQVSVERTLCICSDMRKAYTGKFTKHCENP